MDKLSRSIITKLRRLDHDATPGPWTIYGDNIEDAEKIPLVTLTKEHFDDKNAELITELRNAMPRLLRLIELQEREIRQLKGHKGPKRPSSPTVLQ